MPTAIVMPKLADDMREGKIISWKKKAGDKVESGEVIAEIETDKANLDVEAYTAGTLVKIVAEAGATVPCGQPIAFVAEEGEAAEAPGAAEVAKAAAPEKETSATAKAAAAEKAAAPAKEAAPVRETAPAKEAAPAKETAERSERLPSANSAGGRVRASPLAKKMAQDGSVDLRSLHGSGPMGRVVKADVEKALAAPHPEKLASPAADGASAAAQAQPARANVPAARAPAPPMREELLPLSGMRKAIARRMIEAKPGAPHFYLSVDIEMGPALELRKQLNEQLAAEWGGTVSVNDLILRASVLALLRFPSVNASFAGDNVQRHGAVHIGFALAVDDGLLTPVIRDAQGKSLAQLARESRGLAERGRARKLRPDEYQGSTFTVSNLGMFGIREFSAIINPGEAAILAVGAVEKRPVVIGDEVRVGQQMTATLSGDHRVIDGAIGAQLLRELKQALEQPLRLLA